MESRSRLPSVLHAVTWALLLSLPVILFALAIQGELGRARLLQAYPGVVLGNGPSEAAIVGILAIGLAPWLAIAFVLWQAQALFQLFRDGLALTLDAAYRIRMIGVGLLFVAAMQVVSRTIQILVLSSGNPAGERILAIRIDLSEVGFLLAAGLMVVIGRSMVDAAKTRQELSEFV